MNKDRAYGQRIRTSDEGTQDIERHMAKDRALQKSRDLQSLNSSSL
jgi:hypothetical protein